MRQNLCKGDIICIKNKAYEVVIDFLSIEDGIGVFKSNQELIENLFCRLEKLVEKDKIIEVLPVPLEELSRWQRFLLWAGYDFGFGYRHKEGQS